MKNNQQFSNYNNETYQVNNINYTIKDESNYLSKYKKQKRPNNKTIPLILFILTLILTSGTLYHIYNIIKINPVDINQYKLDLAFYGYEGEGRVTVNIKDYPIVKNSTSDTDEFLANPLILIDKESGLKNGDKVKIILKLSEEKAKKLNLSINDLSYERNFTVTGLHNKVIIKDNNYYKEKSSPIYSKIPSDINSYKIGEQFQEYPLVDTKNLTEDQVKKWVISTFLIEKNTTQFGKEDYIAEIYKNTDDNLVYIDLRENHSSPAMKNAGTDPNISPRIRQYRINKYGYLEENDFIGWNIKSKIYTE